MHRIKQTPRQRRSARVRRRIATDSRGKVRVSVHRTGRHIYAQAIDDIASRTLVIASTVEPLLRSSAKGSTVEAATMVGTRLGERLKELSIARVVFDRGGFAYKGRVKHLAEAIRKAGIQC